MTYSAQQQMEIQEIRKKYAAPAEDKMEQLRMLDAKVSNKATGISIALGVVGALVMGTGMSLLMSDFGTMLGQFAMPVGIVLGIVGMVMLAVAYPVYQRILKKERERVAPEILRLTDELLK